MKYSSHPSALFSFYCLSVLSYKLGPSGIGLTNGFVPPSGVRVLPISSRRGPASTASQRGSAVANGDTLTEIETETSQDNGQATKVPIILQTESSFSVQTIDRGPNVPGPIHTLTFHSIVGQQNDCPPITIETGKIGRQAAGAVELSRGDTVVYATAARDHSPKDNIDFLPLSVEHQERFSAAGMTSGSYNRRDGRPAEHEILTCRLIDRPLRPLIHGGWRHETQLLNWVLSYDGVRSCDPLAIIASAAALYISDVPLIKPVAAVNVGYIDEQLIVNPTNEQMAESRLHLTVAGTRDGIVMIEGAADFLPEDMMIKAVKFGHDAIIGICEGLEEFGKIAAKEKKLDTIKPPIVDLQERVDTIMTERVDAMYASSGNKEDNGKLMYDLHQDVVAELIGEFPQDEIAIKGALKNLLSRRMFLLAKEKGLRCDGRKLDEIRSLDMQVGLLPRVHGSALFTRGETQVLATATLGDSGMRQKIDKIDGTESKRFYLQYTFPPSCVGETGRVGAPGRREVGHGNLAERALLPTLPDEDDFPYTIRVESLVTESHGSSSMASVCGGCLALMDAGVPIKSPIAGVAMGILLDDKGGVSDENAIIVSDILGTEDFLGSMDFKVAGDKEGITTFQLDMKCEGLTIETMERALMQARVGRLHLLEEMEKILGSPREELPPTVPKMRTFDISNELIGKVIGPGGKQIRAIIEDFGLQGMDVDDNGRVQLSGFETEKLKEAEEFVTLLVGPRGNKPGGGKKPSRPKYEGPEPVVGHIYKGPIKGIHPFGVFVEFLPGAEDGSYPGLEGLCHVSELGQERVRNCEGFMRAMDVEELEVKFLGASENGKFQLSRKAVLEERQAGGSNHPQQPDPPVPEMSDDEIDIIAKAIDGLSE